MKGLSIVLGSDTLPNMVRKAKQAEDGGFDTVWTAELHRSAFLPLAAIATHTNRVAVGSGIALAFVRSPFITALNSMDMNDLSDGRFILGLGAGVRRLNERWHGAAYGAPAPHIRECVEAVRLIIQKAHIGEPISYSGTYYNIDIKGYHRDLSPATPSIPIYLAGVGPIMSATAGRVADGWLGHMLGSPTWFKKVIQPNVAKGLEQAGRNPTEFKFVPTLTCAIDNNRTEARKVAAGTIAFYASVRTYTDFFGHHGFKDETEKIQVLFRQGDIKAAVSTVTDDMVDTFTAAGTADEVDKKLRELMDLAGNVALSAPHHFVAHEQASYYENALLQAYTK